MGATAGSGGDSGVAEGPTGSATGVPSTTGTSSVSSSTGAESDAESDTEVGTETGGTSRCPGGPPTPREAPYIPTIVAVAHDSDAIDVGDLNADGAFDLVNLSRLDGSLQPLLGNGDGTFDAGAAVVLNGSGYPDTVRLAAIADDVPDVVVHMEGPVELWAARGDGLGNWSDPQVYTGTYVRAMDIADLDADGILDLVYVGASNLEVRRGTASETFPSAELYGTNIGSVVRVADVDADGTPDILTADYGSDSLQIYLGTGDGTFAAGTSLVVGSTVSGVDVGDFDGDDLQDIVATAEDDTRVYYGTATGFSSAPGTVISDSPARVQAVDVDANGLDDIVARGTNTVQIHFSYGNREFSGATTFECPAFVGNFVVADFNDDCVPDIATAQGPGQDVCLLLSVRD